MRLLDLHLMRPFAPYPVYVFHDRLSQQQIHELIESTRGHRVKPTFEVNPQSLGNEPKTLDEQTTQHTKS